MERAAPIEHTPIVPVDPAEFWSAEMATVWNLSGSTYTDLDGRTIEATAKFFDAAGKALCAFRDEALSKPHLDLVVVDEKGNWPAVFFASGGLYPYRQRIEAVSGKEISGASGEFLPLYLPPTAP